MSYNAVILRITPANFDAWRAESARFRDYNYRSLWEYSDALARLHGATSERVFVHEGEKVVALAEVRTRSLPLKAGGVAYLSGGPLVRDRDADATEHLRRFGLAIQALADEYVRRRKLTLRVLCPVGSGEWNAALSTALAERGFSRAASARGYRTIVIDTGRSLEEIGASFNKTWRKYLRRAERDGVTTRRAGDDEAFEHVIALHDSLRDRKGFGVALDGAFYRDLQRRLPEEDRLTVILAEFEGRVVGMNLVSALGDTLAGIIGATTPEGASKNAAYTLEWDAVQLAVERGLKRYDLGGIDPEANPGVYTFKKGTHGDDLSAAGPAELEPGALRGAIVHASEGIYKTVKALRSKS